jgi:diguanylate cyclase (GGDEF)-like protein
MEINNFRKEEKIIKKKVNELLYNKYGDSINNYNKQNISYLIHSVNSKYLAAFKECILDNLDEYHKRFYNINECSIKLKQFFLYYLNYLTFFCRPVFHHFYYNNLLQYYNDIKADIFYQLNYKKKDCSENNKTEDEITSNIEKNISSHDALTKVMSRVSYNERVKAFDKLIEENPQDLKFAVCLCDLNNLKLVNDNFGHDNGDVYIISCCKIICNFFKHSPVYRIGGDEFVAVLQTDDFDNLEQLKKDVLEFGITEITKQVPLTEKKSFAAGFAVYDSSTDKSFADVMKRADKEMYENKRMLKEL